MFKIANCDVEKHEGQLELERKGGDREEEPAEDSQPNNHADAASDEQST
jgi:hypothetical protein